MRIKVKNLEFNIEETCIIVFIVCMFSLHARKFFSNYYTCYLFIVFHETAHVLVANLFGKKVTKIYIRPSGLNVNIQRDYKSNCIWLLIYLAGPISNIFLAVIFNKMKIVYEINLALATINLIPLYPLDGYNILRMVLEKIFKKEKAKQYTNLISKISFIFLFTLGIVLAIRNKNISIFVMSIYTVVVGVLDNAGNHKRHNSFMYQKCYKNITKFDENYCNYD